MILDINKQLDEIFKEELLQAEVITTEIGMLYLFVGHIKTKCIFSVYN